jgi:hypothetical protein
MAMRTSLGLALLFVVTAAAGQPGDGFSANYLLDACKAWLSNNAPSDPYRSGRCGGIVETLLIVSSHLPVKACPPKGVTFIQAIRVVVAYIEARPAQMQKNFTALATEALHEAWPCPK